MHKMMLYAFVELITNRVQLGTFAKVFNTIYAVKYDMSRLSYYNSFVDCKKIAGGLAGADFPEPLRAFKSLSKYNGIKLTACIMKANFLALMWPVEHYFQGSFQIRCDEGISTNHTFKYADVIQAYGRVGGIYGALYTAAALLEWINLARLTFTKSSTEIEGLIGEYRKVRDNAGAGPLKIHHSDNQKGDGGMWMKNFPELKAGVVPVISIMDPNLPLATIGKANDTFINTKTAANTWAVAVRNNLTDLIDSSKKILVGIDLEWLKYEAQTRLLQVSFRGQSVGIIH
jgi:hypothetical protein